MPKWYYLKSDKIPIPSQHYTSVAFIFHPKLQFIWVYGLIITKEILKHKSHPNKFIQIFWICSILLYYGAPVDVTNSSGRTPLHVAASVGSLASIISLVDHGANINSTDKKRNTPLFYAKTPDTVKLLVMKYEVDISKIGEKGRIVEMCLFFLNFAFVLKCTQSTQAPNPTNNIQHSCVLWHKKKTGVFGCMILIWYTVWWR